MELTTNDITLVQTCGACPEQYDAYIGDKQVGYLRLRHGTFRVYYPGVNIKLVFEACPDGDGIFEDYEREQFLETAKRAILEEHKAHWTKDKKRIDLN